MNYLNPSAGRTWLRRAGIAVAALGAATGIAAAPAWAGQQPAAGTAPALVKTVTLPAGTSVAHITAGGVQATVIKPDETITCTLKINFPHKSTHFPGTVNVVGTIGCSAAVSRLSIRVGLYFNGHLKAQKLVNSTHKSNVQSNAALPCFNGTYEGAATGLVIFPPGFSPPSSDFGGKVVRSPAKFIEC